MVPEKERKWDREREILKDKLAAQAAMKEKEKQLHKAFEDEKWRMEESLQRLQSNMDQLKEEKDGLQQEKDKLRSMAETKIERRKEELR